MFSQFQFFLLKQDRILRLRLFLEENLLLHLTKQCTEVRFASLLSGGFTTMAVINPPEKKLANRTSVHCLKL